MKVKMMDQKKKKVLEEAKKLFLNNGIINTSMSDIADIFNVNRRSIYRLFATKEDIAYKIAISILKEWNGDNEKEYALLGGNGLKKLETFLYRLIDDMNEKYLEMKFLTEFDFYFRNDPLRKVDIKNRDEYEEVVMNANVYIKNLLREGVNDGSMNSEINVRLMESTISNVLWSFGQNISIRGNTIEKETGIDPILIIKNQVKLYIKALK